MEPNTLRLPPNTWTELSEEADKLGYSSRSEYIRALIEHRNAITEVIAPNTKENTEANTDVIGRLDELEQRVDDLEAKRELADRARDVQEAETEELEELQELIDEGKEAGRSESAEPATDDGEARADSEGASETVHADAGDARDDVARAVATVAESWSDDPDRLEARKAAATAVLTAALEADAIGRAEAVEGYFHEYPVPGQSERTWWRKNVRPVLSEYGAYSQGQQGYVVTELPSE